MARISIIPSGSRVTVDGKSHNVDVSDIVPPTTHAIQWDDVAETGHIERTDSRNQPMTKGLFETQYRKFVDRWQVEEDKPVPPAPPPPDPPTDPRLDDLPDTVDTIVELRAAINELKAYLRGDP